MANAAATVGGSWSPEPAGNLPILYSAAYSLGYGGGNSPGSHPSTLPNGLSVDPNYQAALALLMGGQSPQVQAPSESSSAASQEPQPAPAPQPRAERPAEEPKPERDPEPAAETRSVTVKGGDTLSQIAAANGTTWQELYAIPENRELIGDDPNLIRPGQELKLP